MFGKYTKIQILLLELSTKHNKLVTYAEKRKWFTSADK